MSTDFRSRTKSITKYHEERIEKVKKAIFTFLQDHNVEIISDDQVFFEGKNQDIISFSDKLKWILENKNKDFPVLTNNNYMDLIREINSDNKKALELITPNNSRNLNQIEIHHLTHNENLQYSKSLEQAHEFLQHILFKVSDNSGLIKVVAKRFYEVIDKYQNRITIEKEVLFPGFKSIKDYEETLQMHLLRDSQMKETYWDSYNRSSAVTRASMVYHPRKTLYWCDEYKHYYINTYKEPDWKLEPTYFYLMQQHKSNPITFNKLSPILKSFLIHLFPEEESRREVLKWCAFSGVEKLQTYLTLIGAPGIGKTLFVEELLSYYHGEENINFPKSVEMKYNDKCAKSTLLYFDEKMMTNIEQYNEMKCYVNKKLAFEEKYSPIYMSENFANVVWSCNTKDTMSGMSRDDRRFKIVPVTDNKLPGAPINDDYGNVIDLFSDLNIKMIAQEEIKKEFVLLMLAIVDHVEDTKEAKHDINSIADNEARDIIFSESRSTDFIEIIDVLKNVYNDFNIITNKFGNRPQTTEEKEITGVAYVDYIPLSKIEVAHEDRYTYRVPFAIVRKVLLAKAGKYRPMSLRTFNRHLDNMPSKLLRGFTKGGQMRDVEIRLTGSEGPENHFYFQKNLLPLLKNKFLKTVKEPSENPFED